MARKVHTSLAQFRVNDELLIAAKKKADRSGMSLSEYLRAALRNQLREAA
jgi:predicted DNA binding CopG/RHH family protein